MGSSYPSQVCESISRNNKCRPTSRQSKSSERRAEFIAPPPPNCPPPGPLAASGQVYKEVYSGNLCLPPPAAIASRYKKQRQPTASIISNGHHQVNGHHHNVPNGHARPNHQTEYSSKNSGYHDSEDLMQWNNHSEPGHQVKSKNNQRRKKEVPFLLT